MIIVRKQTLEAQKHSSASTEFIESLTIVHDLA